MSSTTWLIVGVGTLVAGSVFAILWWRWAGWRGAHQHNSFPEDELAWEELLQLVERRGRQLADAGFSEDLLPEKLLRLLLLPQQDVDSLDANHDQRRSPRRWGNPIRIVVNWALWERHGMVINRSETGLALFLDVEVPEGNVLRIRSADAAYYVPWVEMEVRYSKKIGRNFVVGCRYHKEVPSNVRVWFG